MTLITDGVIGQIPDQEQDAIAEAWQEVYDRACQNLSIAGFDQHLTIAAVPFPEVTPDHYVHMEGEQYTVVMAAVDYWFGRAKEWVGWVDAQLICLEGEYKDIIRESKLRLRDTAKLVVSKRSDLPKETELKEQAERQPYPRQLAQKITELKAQKTILDSRVAILERFAAGLSRQVTIRGQEIDLQGKSTPRRHPGRFGG